MRTVLLRVADAGPATPAHPVRLFVDDDAAPPTRSRATGTLPAELPALSYKGRDLAVADVRPEELTREDLRAAVGAHLLALLTAGRVGRQLEAVGNGPGPARFVLDVRPERLRRLPWELLARDGRFLFVDGTAPWSRGTASRPRERPRRLLGPLRVLVVVCDPWDARLAAGDELEGIHRAVARAHGRIHLDVVDAPTSPELFEQVETLCPHVLHMIGHTRVAAQGAQLEFRTGPKANWWLTREMVTTMPTGLSLVVLNNCRTGPSEAEGVRSLSEAFLDRGAGAVVGMRGDVAGRAAVVFAKGLYEGLADGEPVDAAVAAARLGVYRADPGAADWTFPVLQTGVHPQDVLPFRFGASEEDLARLPTIREFELLRSFLDRSEQRRRSWWTVDAEDVPRPPKPRRNVLLVTGPKEYGKTELTLSCLLTCFLRGRRLQYVNLAAKGDGGGQTKDWLAVLRAVRDGVPGCSLSAPLPAEAFSPFNARLNRLLAGPAPETADSGADGPVADELRRFDGETGHAERRIEQIFEEFLAALGRAAQDRLLVLALDHVERILPADWSAHVRDKLVLPVARGVGNVRLILVVPEERRRELLGEDDELLMEKVEVGGFEMTQLDRLVREYAARFDRPAREAAVVRDTVTFYARGAARVDPKVFREIERFRRLFGRELA